jgi:protein O-GlcNAc transferase
MKIIESLQSALAYHQAGNLQQAENIYKDILSIEPGNFHALHYMGILYYQTKQYDSAIKTIEKALQVNPADANAHYNLGNVYKDADQYDDAIRCFEKSIDLNPDNADAYINTGLVYRSTNLPDKAISYFRKAVELNPNHVIARYNLGITYKDKGLIDDAVHSLEECLAINPNNFAACYLLGQLFQEKGQIDKAIFYYESASQLNPNFADVYYQLGLILQDKEELDRAIENYQKALQYNPGHFAALNNLGTIFKEKGNIEEAIRCYQNALELNPNIADTYNNLGDAYQKTGDVQEAIDCYKTALQRNPKLPSAYNNLGNALILKGHFDEAIIYYQKGIGLDPSPEAYNNLGIALCRKGQLQEAMSCFQNALAIDPNFANAYISLGTAFIDKGQSDEAEIHLRRALKIRPDSFVAYSNLLLYLNYSPRYSSQELYSEHLNFEKQFAASSRSKISRHTNHALPSKRLKIGYVSPDFKRHPVAYFIETVLAAHNRDNCEVFCYSDVPYHDEMTTRIMRYSDHWRNIIGRPDEMVFELIQKDGIDILVDLAGHTAHNRLLLFAKKPAPVQVSWIGYPATTGLSSLDYKIVDKYTDPPGMTEQYYTEELIRMPESFLCYSAEKDAPGADKLPALASCHITFGSFNNFAKISPGVVSLWASILQMIPGSGIIIKAKSLSDGSTREYIMDMFARQGTPSGRIELLSWEPSSREHLDIYNRIDIGLDTFPYNGTTTTCEALWMGVPVITLAGNTHASRVGASLLSNIGLPELVAQSDDEYLAIAVNLSGNLKKLRELRESLRSMMMRSPLTDAKRFVLNLESCYRSMWVKWRSKG